MNRKTLEPNTIVLLSIIKKELNRDSIAKTLKQKVEELEKKIILTLT
jgi:hypothetical protein